MLVALMAGDVPPRSLLPQMPVVSLIRSTPLGGHDMYLIAHKRFSVDRIIMSIYINETHFMRPMGAKLLISRSGSAEGSIKQTNMQIAGSLWKADF